MTPTTIHFDPLTLNGLRALRVGLAASEDPAARDLLDGLDAALRRAELRPARESNSLETPGGVP